MAEEMTHPRRAPRIMALKSDKKFGKELFMVQKERMWLFSGLTWLKWNRPESEANKRRDEDKISSNVKSALHIRTTAKGQQNVQPKEKGNDENAQSYFQTNAKLRTCIHALRPSVAIWIAFGENI